MIIATIKIEENNFFTPNVKQKYNIKLNGGIKMALDCKRFNIGEYVVK